MEASFVFRELSGATLSSDFQSICVATMAAEAQKPSHRRDRLLEIQKWAQGKWEASKVLPRAFRHVREAK